VENRRQNERRLNMTFDWSVYTGNLTWLPERTIYLTKHGSHSYGTNIPTSDLDIRGIAVPPRNYYIGLTNNFEQASVKEPDMVIFEIRKFLKLASECNPNALEIIFTEPEDHLLMTPAAELLIENRDLFLTKRVKHTFQGYAHAQMKRILTHRRWLLNPVEHQPTRKECGLPERTLIPQDQISAANSAIKKKIDEWSWKEMDDLDPALRQSIHTEFYNRLVEITSWQDDEIESKTWRAAANTLGFDTNFIDFLDKERLYTNKYKEWKQYQEWKANRNPKRAELEAKYHFDCYADDTEFLTSDGWKEFNDITDDCLLATVFIKEGIGSRRFLGVEYQKPIDKFDSLYSGSMYHIYGIHTDSLVTANHKMLIQKSERKSKKKHGWVLEEAAVIPDTFDVLIAPLPRKTTFSNKEIFNGLSIPVQAYLSLMGWYLSDGCAVFNTYGDMSAASIRISQKPGGKLSGYMKRWNDKYCAIAHSSIYTYTRHPSTYNPREHEEMILDVRDKNIITRIINECNYKENKRIPRYIFNLSQSLLECLLFALIRGDGTIREHVSKLDSYIYYSKSKDLANDVQELALMAGWETALWGPYLTDTEGRECLIYQVHLRKNKNQIRTLIRSSNVEKITVENKRVVCFTVPNGTLITRRNGKIGIHGNCKHTLHLVRLSRACKELLLTGKLNVKRQDAEELIAIRNGAWTFEYLCEWFEKQSKEIEEAEKISLLPKAPNHDKIDKLSIKIIELFW
jgi:predicted nucleotidyltransferase